MIELKNNELVFRFPELHDEAVCRVDFQRTLRIPDDNREYPLPPGLGQFPMEHVKDHAARLPSSWVEQGGVLLPMYQAEALWINFARGDWHGGRPSYPFAVKIAAGKINAVTGDGWDNCLVKEPQDYVVVPDQPWIDGFCVKKGLIRQFVAMPLGHGYTAEEQISGAAEHGGIQIIIYPMKRERYEEMLKEYDEAYKEDVSYSDDLMCCESAEMGLAPGGLMRQEIYEDRYGYDAWDLSRSIRCFIHILNSKQWRYSTGKAAPGKPPTATDYENAGLPWFDYYDDKLRTLSGAKKLAEIDSVVAKGVKLGKNPLKNNEPVSPTKVVKLGNTLTKVSTGKPKTMEWTNPDGFDLSRPYIYLIRVFSPDSEYRYIGKGSSQSRMDAYARNVSRVLAGDPKRPAVKRNGEPQSEGNIKFRHVHLVLATAVKNGWKIEHYPITNCKKAEHSTLEGELKKKWDCNMNDGDSWHVEEFESLSRLIK